MAEEPAASPRPVPWRTIAATIAMVLATVVLIQIFLAVSRILVWIVIALFFAVVLTPPVNFVERRLHVPRSLAILMVFLTGFLLLGGMLYAFIRPVVDQSQEFVDNFPRYVEDAKQGRGPLGSLVERFELDRRIEERQDDIKRNLNRIGSESLTILRGVGNAVAATLTIVVLTILMLLSGPRMLTSGLGALSPPSRGHVRHVASDCARAVSGYVAGNLLISLIAGFTSLTFLFFAGVPFRTVLALWVGFADLIPLVGATLGAIPAVLVAFLHSTPAGIATIVFFVVYQQFENHVLQVTIMAKTVDLNPLVVLVSVLIGVELAGLLGALLAIPVAGVIQVIGRDLYDQRRGRFKDEPTIGTDEVPVSELVEREQADSGEPAGDDEAGRAEPEGDGAPAEEKELVPAAVAPVVPASVPAAPVAAVVTGPVEEPPAAAPARGPVDSAPGDGDWPVVESSAGDSTDHPTAGDEAEPDRRAPE